MSDVQNSDIERRLAGRTLQVYLYLQKKREASGIREVQRELGLSSPSVAEYQVEKLIEMGIAGRDNFGRVFVTRKVKVKAMASYVSVGRFMVPRLAFYASIFTGVAALYAVFNFNSLNAYGVSVPAGAAAIFWFEAYKLWKQAMNKNAKKGREKDYFWVSLMPGLAALAVFAAAIFFLFYHVEPSSTAVDSLPPISPISPTKPGPDNPVRADDIPVAEHGLTVELFWIGLSPMNMAMLLFVSALAAGFVIFVMAKYRDEGVRALEQGWN